MESYYDILECDTESSLSELKEAYHKLILKFHPDKNSENNSRFKSIDEAWKTLRDPDKRKEYDESLKQRELEEQTLLYGTYCLDDLNYNKISEMYSCPCRCGGIYNFTKKDFEEFNSYLVSCDQCSLVISVDLQTKF